MALTTHNFHINHETTDLSVQKEQEQRFPEAMWHLFHGHYGGRWLLLGFEPTTFGLAPAKLLKGLQIIHKDKSVNNFSLLFKTMFSEWSCISEHIWSMKNNSHLIQITISKDSVGTIQLTLTTSLILIDLNFKFR